MIWVTFAIAWTARQHDSPFYFTFYQLQYCMSYWMCCPFKIVFLQIHRRLHLQLKCQTVQIFTFIYEQNVMWKSTLLKTIQKIAMPFKQKNNVISFVMPFVGPHIRSSIIFRSSHPTAQYYYKGCCGAACSFRNSLRRTGKIAYSWVASATMVRNTAWACVQFVLSPWQL